MELKGSEAGNDGTYVLADVVGATLTLTRDGQNPNFSAELSKRIKLEIPDTS